MRSRKHESPRLTESRPGEQGGFTILELLMVLAIVAGLAVALTMGIRRVRNSDLRSDTSRVAAALRTAYSLAAQTGQHHRVMFDLEKQTFQIEACEGDVKLRKQRREELELDDDEVLPSPDTSDVMPGIQDAESPQVAVERAVALSGQMVGVAQCGPFKRPDGKEDERSGVHSIRTWNDIEIKRIYVQHLEEPVTDELVSINFFPLGYAEKAVVVIGDDDGNSYTLLVHGLTGRIEFRDGEWRKPDEHMLRDGAGDEAEER